MRTISIKKGLSIACDPGGSLARGHSDTHTTAKKLRFDQTRPTPSPAMLTISDKDFPEVRPDLKVNLSDRVAKGQLLFTDKKNHHIKVFSDVNGVVRSLDLGRRRSLKKLEIEVDRSDVVSDDYLSAEATQCYKLNDEIISLINSDSPSKIQDGLLQAGLFSAFRTRPFDRVPDARTLKPQHIFVTAMDTNPYTPCVRAVFRDHLRYFQTGLETVSKLTNGNVYVCQSPGSPLAKESKDTIKNIAFEGPHPAGNAGTHVQALYPLSRNRLVWVIDYQEVIAIGKACSKGLLSTTRLISIMNAETGQVTIATAMPGMDMQTLLSGTIDTHTGEEAQQNRMPDYRFWSGDAFCGNWSSHLGRFDRHVFLYRSTADSSSRPRGLVGKVLQKIPFTKSRTHSSTPPLIAEPWLDTISPLTNSTSTLLRSLICGDMETAEACGCLKFVTEDISPLDALTGNRYGFTDLLRASHRHIENELLSS